MPRTIFVAAQPSHSDDTFSNAPERICLDTSSYSYPDFDDNLMVIR